MGIIDKMIIDKIENHKLYRSLSNKIAVAFDYLNNTDLSEIPLGKHEIDGEKIFAIIMEYKTKDKSESKTIKASKKAIVIRIISIFSLSEDKCFACFFGPYLFKNVSIHQSGMN